MSSDFIKLPCPNCQKRIKLTANKRNKKIVCPSCQYLFKLAVQIEQPVSAAPDSLEELLSHGTIQPQTTARNQTPTVVPIAEAAPAAVPVASIVDVTPVAVEPTYTPAPPSIVQPSQPAAPSRVQSPPVSMDPEESYWEGPNYTGDSSESDEPRTRSEKLEKSKQWLADKQADMDSSEGRLHRIALILLVGAVGATLLPFVGLQWRLLASLGTFAPIGGVIVGLVGAGILGYTLRRTFLKALLTTASVGIIIIAIGVFGFFVERAGQAGELNNLANAMGAQPDLKIETPEPQGRRILRSDWERERRAALESVPDQLEQTPTLPKRPFIEVDRPAIPPNESFGNPDQDSKGQTTPFENFDPEMHRGNSNAEENDASNGISNQPRDTTRLSPSEYVEKRDQLTQRVQGMSTFRINKNRLPAAQFDSRFEISQIAGKPTIFGNVIYSDAVLTGLDVLPTNSNQKQGMSKIVPIVGQAQYSNSLTAQDSGYFLSAINVHIENSVIIGVQALLAARGDLGLEHDNPLASTWIGEPGDAFQVDSLSSFGKDIYGIVVYEEKLEIVGIALITKRQ